MTLKSQHFEANTKIIQKQNAKKPFIVDILKTSCQKFDFYCFVLSSQKARNLKIKKNFITIKMNENVKGKQN